MGDSSSNVLGVVGKIIDALQPLDDDDRAKVMGAVASLVGVPMSPGIRRAAGANVVAAKAPVGDSGHGEDTLEDYFAAKAPGNKGEDLVVAAKYALEAEGLEVLSKEDFARLITGAGKNFDGHNFARDMKNARAQAGFFLKNQPRDQHKISYYGKQYVDALPDREAVKRLPKPVVKRASKNKAKSAGTK